MTIKIGKNLYGDKIFYRVKMRCSRFAAGKTTETTVIFWAQKRWDRAGGKSVGYQMCGKDGATRWNGDTKLCELAIAHKDDVIYEKKARMNLHYAELEVVKK